ncbi:unnamed protein product [Toxocara canis]|uniref:TOG domain-containing protein n=1 Tax=Toxocara canis TaxID=6265 RepID=A0A183VGU5_TOXCA|nr:unnamed protein product [Toxocara canis]
MENHESIMANCDLILKWISLRFFETNPTVLLRVLDLSLAIFTQIRDSSESFTDAEMNTFLPYLIMKMGEPKDSVRTPVRSIVHLVTDIMGPPKVFPLILDGLKTKNSRQKTECLQVLEELLDTTGVAATTTPGPSLKQIAACIGDRDNNVRNAAINAVIAAWKEEGDRVFQLIGKMSDKDRAMLCERIKRSGAASRAKGNMVLINGLNGSKFSTRRRLTGARIAGRMVANIGNDGGGKRFEVGREKVLEDRRVVQAGVEHQVVPDLQSKKGPFSTKLLRSSPRWDVFVGPAMNLESGLQKNV